MRRPVTEEEMREIYRATIDGLYAYASRRCGGVRELAEDITQEVWLRAVREWRQKGVPDVPLAWLTTVARNLILNSMRQKESVSLDAVSPTEVLAAVDADELSESAEVATAVSHALARIPPAEAQLLEAFHYERYKVAQLAVAYGISERAIEGRLRRARERLRRELEISLNAHGGLV